MKTKALLLLIVVFLFTTFASSCSSNNIDMGNFLDNMKKEDPNKSPENIQKAKKSIFPNMKQ